MRGTDELESAFDEAFNRLYPQARVMAYRMLGDVSAAEDVAAEALTRTYVRWRRMASVDHLDAWVLRVAANLAIDAVRRKHPRLPADREAAAADGVVLRMALAESLRSLPRRQREVIVLRYLADLREQDVAEALGITEGSVKTHAHRALETLRQQLGNRSLEEATTHA